MYSRDELINVFKCFIYKFLQTRTLKQFKQDRYYFKHIKTFIYIYFFLFLC
jgi:hypothetical protein